MTYRTICSGAWWGTAVLVVWHAVGCMALGSWLDAWGQNDYGQLDVPVIGDAAVITAGSTFAVAQREDGSLLG